MSEFLWTSGRGIIDKDTIWFVPSNYSCLCQYDYKEDRLLKFIFLEGATAVKGTHYSLLKYTKYIILIPTRDMNIFIYNMEKAELQRIRLKGTINDKEKFVAYAVWNQYVYMFPVVYPGILKLNMENLNLEYIKWERAEEFSEADIDYADQCVTIGSVANLLLIESNKICEYNMKTDTGKEFIIGEEDIHYKTICQYGESGLLLSDQYGNFLILNEKKEKVGYIPSEEEICFNNCIPVMDGYLFIPCDKDEDCIYWDGSNRKKISMNVKIESTEWAKNWKYATYSRSFYDDNLALIFNIVNRSACVLDRKTCTMQERHILLENLEEGIVEKLYAGIAENGIANERKIAALSLEGLLEHVEKNVECRKELRPTGDKIYHMLMQNI